MSEYLPANLFKPIKDPRVASEFFSRLEHFIKKIEGELTADEEIHLILNSGANDDPIVKIYWMNPDLFAFETESSSGERAIVLVHLYAVNLCLSKVSKVGGRKRAPIGFVVEEEGAPKKTGADPA